ncbi:hypothetical protein SUDANB178_06409 [Streptomyces sp. enrichment culture]
MFESNSTPARKELRAAADICLQTGPFRDICEIATQCAGPVRGEVAGRAGTGVGARGHRPQWPGQSVMLPIFQTVMDLTTLPSPKRRRPRESWRKG